ncbi:hypothetical protein P8C59_005437 [Phyllachora maydis]|uniref:Ubiquitin-like modifier HUB1 n=1 Tax=Phyllachora maydis TaxID=1825666 RepID=A0AAD9MDH6_9PEZI|nr:hypothetical protein P8C59_005437 [Phyllachora maydis]
MADSYRRTSRSPSPPRKAPKGSGGFRWKDKRPGDEGPRDGRDRPAPRAYRDRSPRRHPDRDRERGDDDRRDRDRRRGPSDDRRQGGDDGAAAAKPDANEKEEKKAKANKKAAKAAAGGPMEEMIIVNINDRLGTKTQIPCLPGDTILQLKTMVAMRIGREPHEILLKRQGERPFKNQLSLADYSISNGVQLDLEVDTGD